MSVNKVLAVIPARYGSTRFPGKALAMIRGIPMILRVYRRASGIRGIDRVIVATDDRRIQSVILCDEGESEMTSVSHRTGTSRVREVAGRHRYGIVLNIQGDEPLLPVGGVERLIELMRNERRTVMATLAAESTDGEEMLRRDVVKVACDLEGNALYFSRSPIPHDSGRFLKHVGIYAFRRGFLLKYYSLPQGPLEKAESLEQLRAVENGYRIRVLTCGSCPAGVDRPEDIKRVEKCIGKG